MHKGEYLKYLIRQKGFRQDAVASKINYHASKLSRILNNSNPKEEDMLVLLEFLEMSQQDFEAGFRNLNSNTTNEGNQSEFLKLQVQHITEKGIWLDEKSNLLTKIEELQEDNDRLRGKLRDKEE